MSWSIATWNVNSLRAREEHVVNWLKDNRVDVLAIQETKVVNDLFPAEAFLDLGYHLYYRGQKSYNGVAIFVKNVAHDIVDSLEFDEAKRYLALTVDGIRVINVYVPNGQSIGSEKFQYKQDWLDHLLIQLEKDKQTHDKIILLGDFNIAPAEVDVYDATVWSNTILTSDIERAYIKKIQSLGLVDLFRDFSDEPGFSWWDYRSAAYRRGNGLRIDLMFASNNLKNKLLDCYVDTNPRIWDKPSDHAPVVAQLNYLP